jgi:hypothetical protein
MKKSATTFSRMTLFATLSITLQHRSAMLSIAFKPIGLSAVLLNVILLIVVMLNVVVLSVVAPKKFFVIRQI